MKRGHTTHNSKKRAEKRIEGQKELEANKE